MSGFEILLGLGTAFSGIGAIAQGQAQAQNYQAQQKAAEYNATIQRQQAEVVAQQANQQQESELRQGAQIQGEQIAGLAQNGVDVSTGSPLDVLKQDQANLHLQVANTGYQGYLNQRGFNLQAEQTDYQGKVAGYNAGQAGAAGLFGGATALLSGGASYYGNQQNKRGR
jgi:hypothetical protein